MRNKTKTLHSYKAIFSPVVFTLLLSSIFLPNFVQGQSANSQPRMLSESDLGKWERIGFRGTALSPDGKWLIYSITRNNRENELRLHDISKNSLKVLKNSGSVSFSSDSKWLGVLISPNFKTTKALRKEKKPVRRTFELLNLTSGTSSKVKNISSFSFSADGKFLVLNPYPPEKSKSTCMKQSNLFI